MVLANFESMDSRGYSMKRIAVGTVVGLLVVGLILWVCDLFER
jgi:hypothetical protein